MWKFFLGLGFSLLLLQAAVGVGTAADGDRHVHVLTVDDQIIGPVIVEYIEEGIKGAEESGAAALIIVLDTPGGLLNSTRTIVKEILGAKVPVVVYVGPRGSRAGSAGVFITLAAHVAAMAPSTNIGAAHPVSIGGDSPPKPKEKDDEGIRELIRSLAKGKKDEKAKDADKKTEKGAEKTAEETKETPGGPMEAKVLNDTIAWVTAIANERGRNADWAMKAVRESASITEREALEKNVVDVVAEDIPNLLSQIDGRTVKLGSEEQVLVVKGADIVKKPMSKRQELLSILINPNIAYLLMMLGFYGLLFEITHPGSWIPGIAGLICLILAFYSFQTIPTNYAGFALIAIAIGLFVAEAFVPSFGLLTVGGIICMVLGSLFLIDSPFELMQISFAVIIPIVLATAFVAVFLVSLAAKAAVQKHSTGLESFIGDLATAETDLDPNGKVFIDGEIWYAHCDQPVEKGEKVKIEAVDGMNLKVTKVKETS